MRLEGFGDIKGKREGLSRVLSGSPLTSSSLELCSVPLTAPAGGEVAVVFRVAMIVLRPLVSSSSSRPCLFVALGPLVEPEA